MSYSVQLVAAALLCSFAKRALLLVFASSLIAQLRLQQHPQIISAVQDVPYVVPDEYSTDLLMNCSYRQKHFVLDTWLVQKGWANPSMTVDINHRHRVVMLLRQWDRRKHDKVGYLWLDPRHWSITKPMDMLELIDPGKSRSNLIGEDVRIFSWNGRLHIVYNNHLEDFKRVFTAEVFYAVQGDIFYVLSSPQYIRFEHTPNTWHEKNWSPFEYCPQCVFEHGVAVPHESGHHRSQLLFVYSLQPHLIVQTYRTSADKLGERVAERVFSTQLPPQFQWKWGQMRGGTPALRIGNHYLSFFHSSGRYNWRWALTYVMGAYLFECEPPFAITHMSTEPIMHPMFLNESLGGWAWRTVDYVIFPMGMTIDEKFIHVSYGRNDRDGWMLKLDRMELLRSLQPVQSEIVGTSDFNKDTGEIQRGSYRMVLNATLSDRMHS